MPASAKKKFETPFLFTILSVLMTATALEKFVLWSALFRAERLFLAGPCGERADALLRFESGLCALVCCDKRGCF